MTEPSTPDSAVPLGAHLQEAVAGLAAARTRSQILQTTLQVALQATHASRGAALLLDASREHLTRLEWWPAAAAELTGESAHIERFLATEALQRGETLFFERAKDVQAAFPVLSTQNASATLPLLLKDIPLGALVLKYPDGHLFTQPQRQFLQTLAGQCAVALSRQHERTQREKQEQRFQRLVEESPVGIAAGDLAGHLILANDAYLSMFGFTRAEFKAGQIDWLNLTPPEYLPGDEVAFQRAFSEGRSGRYEKEMLTREGERLPVSVNLIRYDEGESPYVVGYVQDLRPFRAAEQALRDYSSTLEQQVSERTRRLEQQNAELEARTRALEGFADLTRDLALDSDEANLILRAQQLAQSLLPDGFAVYYEPEGNLWRLKSQVGDLGSDALQALLDAGLPFEQTQNLLIPWRSGTPFYQDAYDMNLDQLTGSTVGQLQSTATIPVQVTGKRRGVFGFGLNVALPWRRADKAVLESIALSLGSALERVQRNRRLEAERAGLDAFARFTEAVADETNVHALARRAVDVLVTTLGQVTVAYYDLEDNLWKARMWSAEVPTQLVEFIQQGVPVDTPVFARALESAEVTFFTDVGIDQATTEKLPLFGAGAFLPYFVNGQPQGLLTVGTRQQRDWTEREQAIIRAVGRSLGLALERSSASAQLRQQNAQLEARTRALEGFADLTREIDFQSDPYALIRRAQQVLLTLIPPGYVDYFELDGDHWRSRVRSGERRNPELQTLVDQGLPYAPLMNLRHPFESQQPYYQDTYDQHTDQLEAQVQQLGATATLPVCVNGEPQGIMAIGLFSPYRWPATDRGVLETVVRSLEIALEGAQAVTVLRHRTQELERSNRELEQFAYVASHDLQEPLRSVTSFSQLLLRRLDTQDPKAQRYAQFITEGTERMGQLIQDLLAFSRVATQGREPQMVNTARLLEQVIQDLNAQIEQVGATVTVDSLPPVKADATQVRQVFQNLIGNALKFTDPQRPASVRVSAEADGQMVRFCVQDNGIGIAPEHFEKIFTIFQRLHRRDEYEGSGIGLSIARRIVERHGGTIWPESTPGYGTAFYFTLPAAK